MLSQRVHRGAPKGLGWSVALMLLFGGLASCSPIVGDGSIPEPGATLGGPGAPHSTAAPSASGSPRRDPSAPASGSAPASSSSARPPAGPGADNGPGVPGNGDSPAEPGGSVAGDPAGTTDSNGADTGRPAHPGDDGMAPRDAGTPGAPPDGSENPGTQSPPAPDDPVPAPGDDPPQPAPTAPTPRPNSPGTMTVEGINRVGYSFRAVLSDADGVPTSGVSYRWHEFYGALVGSGETIELTGELVGMQFQVTAEYMDNAGHRESVTSRFTAAVAGETVGDTGRGIASPAGDAPRISLSGPESVAEGATATYTVTLDRPAKTDVSADIRIIHETTDPKDAGLRWDSQRVVIKAGQISATFQVDATEDGISEDPETYRVTISNAVVGTVHAPGVAPIQSGSGPQSVFMLSYRYPLATPGSTALCDYWQAIHAAGSEQIPYVMIIADASPNATVDPGYVQGLQKNVELGFQNIAYIRTNQQTRDIAEVVAEVEKLVKLYGEDMIQGFYFDEISGRSNAATAYLAELYNYVKEKHPDKLVVANPGSHIPDAIAPYADIFMTNEGSADDYLNHYSQPSSAFENDPANSHRIMHAIYDAQPGDYRRIIDAARSRNAGLLYITTDTTALDGRPYNDLPADFPGLVKAINDHGKPADPYRGGTLPVLAGARIGTADVTTTITPALR